MSGKHYLEAVFLNEIIPLQNIKTNINAENWEQAVRISGELLLKNKSIKENYILKMIENVKKYGPYIVISPGIALAHAESSDDVLKNDISMIILKNGVKFGNKANDPVKIIISFSAKESKSHLKILSKLSEIMDNKDFYKKITNINKSEEIYTFINK
ncbi:mannitol/fructose-specific phosphotransferase system IIA component (Ntr-type) [Oceanotoga teriensis]|uniref:Ascorbate-specific PTS system EIIA component n=1 Tax=Oceanotoga teriensis TaxID=515440 RepID=A0AA45C596_9BACT|nr:mannitol/fructose-specific phosphotransferase system IIA component (Ntr-type) [Oceanotoga teriensis]